MSFIWQNEIKLKPIILYSGVRSLSVPKHSKGQIIKLPFYYVRTLEPNKVTDESAPNFILILTQNKSGCQIQFCPPILFIQVNFKLKF
jgi:hypothetical protein